MTSDIRILSVLRKYYEEKALSTNSQEDADIHDALLHGIQALETHGWIPVSERLPEKMGRYLCTVGASFRNPREMYYTPQEWADKRDDATWRSVDGSYVFDWFVTAWQPLPESYKAESKIEQTLAYADQDTLMSAT